MEVYVESQSHRFSQGCFVVSDGAWLEILFYEQISKIIKYGT